MKVAVLALSNDSSDSSIDWSGRITYFGTDGRFSGSGFISGRDSDTGSVTVELSSSGRNVGELGRGFTSGIEGVSDARRTSVLSTLLKVDRGDKGERGERGDVSSFDRSTGRQSFFLAGVLGASGSITVKLR